MTQTVAPRMVGGLTVYDLYEVSGMLRVHLDTLRRYVREGRLKAAKVGKTYLMTEGNLKEFLEGKTIQGLIVDLRKAERRKETVPVLSEHRMVERRQQDIFHPIGRT